jgi:RNA polymerase sigma-70 factor, ECF subfamily
VTDEAPLSQVHIVQSHGLPHTDAGSGAAATMPSFEAVFEDHFDYVWATLRRLGVQERDLEDLSQDVFLRVFGQLDHFDASRPVRPWLFGFAFRVASDYRRLARNRCELLDLHDRDPTDPAPSALERVLRTEALTLAQAALEELDLDRRAVFILHELDDCPIPEVAAALSIPLNTAYSRLRLAREQFADCVRRLRLRRGER